MIRKLLLFLFVSICSLIAMSQRSVEKAAKYDLIYFSGGNVYAANLSEWKKLKNKSGCEPIGIVLENEDEKFVVGVRDWFEILDGYYNWEWLEGAFPDYMPNYEEGRIIAEDEQIRDIAKAYLGNDPFGNYYWTNEGSYDSDITLLDILFDTTPPSSEAYVFCPGIPDAPITKYDKEDAGNMGFMDVYRLNQRTNTDLFTLLKRKILTPAEAIEKLQRSIAAEMGRESR